MTVSARLGAGSSDGRESVFATSGRTITFPGFLKAYVQGSDDPESDADDAEKVLPALAVGDALAVQRLEPTGHETRPRPATPRPRWCSGSKSSGWDDRRHTPRS